MPHRAHELSRRERQIMDILYRRGRATAGDVMVLGALALGLNEILRARSAALRHCVLAAALGCAMTMPLVGRLAPAWDVSFARGDLEPVGGSTPSSAAGPKTSQAPIAVDES